MRIAIAGGTGRLGSLLARRLAAHRLEVRVITRDPARAAHLRGLRVQIVGADVRDPVGIRTAIDGASTVVSAVQGFAGPGKVSPESVDNHGNANLIDAAAVHGADVILVSVVGASAEHPMELFRAKHAAEQHLMASGAPWTIVRATAFLELWAEIMRKRIVFGRGENPINFVSVDDVATAVERAVLDGDQRGRVIEVAGPRNLTLNELAASLQHARGESGNVRHIPRPALRVAAPFSRRARAAIAMDTIDMTFPPSQSQDPFGETFVTPHHLPHRQTDNQPQRDQPSVADRRRANHGRTSR